MTELLRNIDPWVIIPNKLYIPVRKIFAHDCSPIMTGGIVPGPSYHSHARLLSQPSGGSEPIWLGYTLVPCLGPLVDTDHTDTVRVETNRPVGWQHLYQSGGPEPAVDIQRLIVSCVTAVNLDGIRVNEHLVTYYTPLLFYMNKIIWLSLRCYQLFTFQAVLHGPCVLDTLK